MQLQSNEPKAAPDMDANPAKAAADLEEGFELDDSDDSDSTKAELEDDLEDLDGFVDHSLACENVTFEKMTALLNIQDNLNRSFVGADWIERAKDRTAIDYQPPILDEAAELMRSLPQWKFWKTGQKADVSNAQLEFIDILHFTLSEALTRYADRDALARTMGFWFEGVFDGWGDDALQRENVYNFQDVKTTLARFLGSVMGFGYVDTSEVEPTELPDSELDLESFWDIAFNLGMSGADVYLTYIGKVALNHFRIANGDKQNNYHRTWWSGEEDNFYLMKQIAVWKADVDSTPPTLESVTEWLQSQYSEYLSQVNGQTPTGLTVNGSI